MASRNFTDATLIPFICENIEKERWLRMHWVNKHKEGLERASTLTREPTDYTELDIQETIIVAGMPTITRDHLVAARNRRTVPIKDINLVKLDKEKAPDQSMMPVPEEVTDVLYNRSRKDYLKIRHLVPPDKKYNYIECTNWKHGWKFDESKIKLRGPEYGTLYHGLRVRELGPQADPRHYCDCDINVLPSLCAEL